MKSNDKLPQTNYLHCTAVTEIEMLKVVFYLVSRKEEGRRRRKREASP
jgi:hypothetical protein